MINTHRLHRVTFLFFSLTILLTAGCKKDPAPSAPSCRIMKAVATDPINTGSDEISYTWANNHIVKAKNDRLGISVIFEYNSNNKIGNYKVVYGSNPSPEQAFSFFYNNDGTYSKIESYYSGKLETVYEFQNSNNLIYKVFGKSVTPNGQVVDDPWAVWKFSYAGNNVSEIITTTPEGDGITTKYTYDNQSNYFKKIHEQFPVMDYIQNRYWNFDLYGHERFFLGMNQNNCTEISSKMERPGDPAEEHSVQYTYIADDKGNLLELKAESSSGYPAYVMGRYTYECK